MTERDDDGMEQKDGMGWDGKKTENTENTCGKNLISASRSNDLVNFVRLLLMMQQPKIDSSLSTGK